MNHFFPEIKKNFGFGCMRLPEIDTSDKKIVDTETFSKMVDAFISAGFNYFDTARPYHGGESEKALKISLTSRYKREDYILANKLSDGYWTCEEDLDPYFESQLEACGVEYFDFYLMHCQNTFLYEKYKKNKCYEHGLKYKAQGKVKHFGISFHDNAELLDKILTENPEIEFVQIQFNYFDYKDPVIQAEKCYNVCVKHKKPVIVMEPVRGGLLATFPENSPKFDENFSPASYAIRFAASHKNVIMTLSGMSNMDQALDNISYMKDFKPLSEEEFDNLLKVAEVYRKQNFIACTSCKYCIKCPKKIPIFDIFACYNSKKLLGGWNSDFYYNCVITGKDNKASACIKCGACEKACPQHLPIRKLLEDVVDVFEKKD